MKQTLLLLAGYPATGKTYMCSRILERFPQLVVLSQDKIKEQVWTEYGLNNIDEKKEAEKMAWDQYYKSMELNMAEGRSIISDYPFSSKQKRYLKEIAEGHGVQVITMRLVGDLDILYQRSLKRDLDESRHLGHLVSAYHKGDVLDERNCADELVTREIFMDRCLNKGYGLFELGYLLEVDVTDFSKINYKEILDQLEEQLRRNNG